MYKKKVDRLKRAKCTRKKLNTLKKTRLVVHRTSKHIYAQIIEHKCSKIIISASTIEKKIKNNLKYTGNQEAAKFIGQIVAERALKKDIKQVSFDRSGFKYHGRVAVLADSARKFGLHF